MTANAEVLEIRRYLLEYPELLPAAHAVSEAWPTILDEVCERFLHHLCEKAKVRLNDDLSDLAPRLRVCYAYGGEKSASNSLFIGLRDRPKYEVGIQSQAKGPNGWVWGVRSPRAYQSMTAEERGYCDRFRLALRDDGLELGIIKDPPVEWPQYEYLPRYRDWAALVPDLHREANEGGGPITESFVNKLLGISKIAIPALDRMVPVE